VASDTNLIGNVRPSGHEERDVAGALRDQARPEGALRTMTTPALDLRLHAGRNYDKGRGLLWQVAWHVVSHAVFQKWWLPARLRPAILRSFGATIGQDVLIRQQVRIHWPWRLRIQGPAWIGHGVWILNLDEVVIEPHACVSQEAMLCTGSHDRHDPAFEHRNGPITVRKGAWVCARSVALAGTDIGEHALVEAGVTVRGRVAPGAVVTAASVAAPRL